MQRKAQEDLQKQKRVEKILSEVNIHVERDPSRLLQPTKGLLNKIASDADPAEQARKAFETTVCPKRYRILVVIFISSKMTADTFLLGDKICKRPSAIKARSNASTSPSSVPMLLLLSLFLL